MARAASFCLLLVLVVSVLSPVTNAQDTQPLAAKVARYVYVPDSTVVSVYFIWPFPEPFQKRVEHHGENKEGYEEE